jgi:hypothetical protein
MSVAERPPAEGCKVTGYWPQFTGTIAAGWYLRDLVFFSVSSVFHSFVRTYIRRPGL